MNIYLYISHIYVKSSNKYVVNTYIYIKISRDYILKLGKKILPFCLYIYFSRYGLKICYFIWYRFFNCLTLRVKREIQ